MGCFSPAIALPLANEREGAKDAKEAKKDFVILGVLGSFAFIAAKNYSATFSAAATARTRAA